MKRSGLLLLALLGVLVLVAFAFPVMADEHEEQIDPHPHILLQRPEVVEVNGDFFLVGFRKCVDLANNQAVPLHAHHEHIHFGGTGVSFGGAAGHAVFPAGHFPTVDDPLPFANCAEFEALFAGG